MDQVQPHLLIVDDDPGIRELLSRYLSEQGYRIVAVGDAKEMDAYLSEETSVDLLILDLMLPGEDGLSIAKRIRTSHGMPIIMLSARGDDIDKIVGLEVGADDYLGKPFNPRELLARIRAVMRRPDHAHQSASDEGSEVANESVTFTFGECELDPGRRLLTRSGEEISLTTGEFNLLQAFVEHPNRALSRDMLVDWIKGYDRSPFDRSIDVRVTRLRQKIELDPKIPNFIHTVWGVGYMFTPEGKQQ